MGGAPSVAAIIGFRGGEGGGGADGGAPSSTLEFEGVGGGAGRAALSPRGDSFRNILSQKGQF